MINYWQRNVSQVERALLQIGVVTTIHPVLGIKLGEGGQGSLLLLFWLCGAFLVAFVVTHWHVAQVLLFLSGKI